MYKKSQAFQVKRKIHGTLQRHRYNKNQVWKKSIYLGKQFRYETDSG